VVGVVIVGSLYWAQIVFIPVALAVFLAFVLHPLVRALQRRGLGHVPAVILVVVLASTLTAGLGFLVTAQVSGLARQLPKYTENITAKIRTLRNATVHSHPLEKMIKEVGGELNGKGDAKKAQTGLPPVEKPVPVVVQPESPAWLADLPEYVGSALHLVGGVALAVALLVFILLALEDLRNRLLRLMHRGRLPSSTRALDEASQRISRYLLMQAIVNGSFGLLVGVGLFVIGVDYALLWGFLAAVLRYIPYIGAWLAAVLPLAMTLAMFEGWWQLASLSIFLLILELVVNNIIEPQLYGHSMGVSAVALLIAAALWAFLWGPIGLVLSAPLTVVLVVMGKYIPQLKFFNVLLADQPALAPDLVYYQRLIARDQHEASELVSGHCKQAAPDSVYDDLLLPALVYAQRDRRNEELTEADSLAVNDGTRELLEQMRETRSEADVQEEQVETPTMTRKVQLIGCPAGGEADEIALHMLKNLLDPAKWEMDIVSAELLTSERLAQIYAARPTVVCIGSLPPGKLIRVRNLCKRLRKRFPNLKILVGRWGGKGINDEARHLGAGVELATTLLESRTQLAAWAPVLTQKPVKQMV